MRNQQFVPNYFRVPNNRILLGNAQQQIPFNLNDISQNRPSQPIITELQTQRNNMLQNNFLEPEC